MKSLSHGLCCRWWLQRGIISSGDKIAGDGESPVGGVEGDRSFRLAIGFITGFDDVAGIYGCMFHVLGKPGQLRQVLFPETNVLPG